MYPLVKNSDRSGGLLPRRARRHLQTNRKGREGIGHHHRSAANLRRLPGPPQPHGHGADALSPEVPEARQLLRVLQRNARSLRDDDLHWWEPRGSQLQSLTVLRRLGRQGHLLPRSIGVSLREEGRY